ncbi:MAG: phytoene desaturase family protein, partial [Vicinamibacterales bacterium]
APFDPLRPRLADLRPVGAALACAARAPRAVLDMATLLTSPAGTILSRWFQSDVLRATLATDSVIGAMVAPSSPGSGYVLLHHVMGEAGGARGRWAYVRGGMGAFSEAIASAARGYGATIETDADVLRVRVSGGRAAGVVLADGREIAAKQVLSGVDPHVTFLRLVEPAHLPGRVRRRVRRLDFSAAAVKINVALDRLPRFTARPPDGDHHELRGTIHLAPTLAGIEAAYRDAVAGEPSREPVVEMTIPSTVDESLALPGQHVASLFVQYAPYAPAGGGWDAPGARARFAERVFALVERYAPGFTASILHHEVLTPPDMERLFGLTGGNIFHGAMTRGQLYTLRPIAGWSGYRTPVPGLYLCGAGAHPGGGVMGACGRNAALVALQDG